LRKEEPKTSLGLAAGFQNRKYPRPGTDPRYTKTPLGTLPTGTLPPRKSIAQSRNHRQSIVE
jgi:hypothetical protein